MIKLTREQATGQLREVLTAVGAALTTWGISDGHGWAPVVGCASVLYATTWGVLHHKDPNKPGVLSWSLVRKAINVIGSAAITYGLTAEEDVASIATLAAVLGPVIAMRCSFISNTEDN